MSKKPYCRPLEADTPSEPASVARRLGKLFDAIDSLNGYVVTGGIRDHLRRIHNELCERLESEGWTVSYQTGQLVGSNRCHVYPPGSPSGKRIRADRERINGRGEK